MSEESDTSFFEAYCIVEEGIKKCTDPQAFTDTTARTEFARKVLTQLQRLDYRIEQSDLFSPNEVVDDISTPNLKYLLISFMLGDFLLCMPCSIDERSGFVHDADLVLRRFLDRLDLYLLLNEENKKALTGKKTTDPVQVRAQKIAKFKREKLLREQLDYLMLARKDLLKSKVGVEDDAVVVENERDIVLLMIESAVDKSIEYLASLDYEQQLQTHHAAQRKEQMHKGVSQEDAQLAGQIPRSQNHGSNSNGHHHHHHHHNGGDEQSATMMTPSSTKIKVHSISSHDDAKAPIPAHMTQFMQKVQQPQKSNQCTQPHVHTAQCQNNQSDATRLQKPWFNPSAMDHCKDCAVHDQSQIPEYSEYMIYNKKGGRGQLAPVCPLHGNAHPAGKCPGIQASDNLTSMPDTVDMFVNQRSDRHAVFRDRNPYLMELDDWVQMKQREGGLPSEVDIQLQNRIKDEYDAHLQRLEDGESDDEYQQKTQKQEYDEEEEEQMKKRAWANYTDDNEKGVGNKNYRR